MRQAPPPNDPKVAAIQLLRADLAAEGPPAGLERLVVELVDLLADCEEGRLAVAAYWQAIAEADGAIEDARRAQAQRAAGPAEPTR